MAFRREAVKELRNRLKLTMRLAASLVGVTASAWCRWEKGNITPSAEYVGKMLEISKDNKLGIEFFSERSSFKNIIEFLEKRQASPDIEEIRDIQEKLDEVQGHMNLITEDDTWDLKVDSWFDQPWFKDMKEYLVALEVVVQKEGLKGESRA